MLTPSNFPHTLPTSNNRISTFDPTTVDSDASQTHIVIHPRLCGLFEAFLSHKRAEGSQYEKALYTTAFTWKTLATRLIAKRPLAFLGRNDMTILRDGLALYDAPNEWDRNGTAEQHLNEALTLKEYLSYDEIMLSSLIGVSGPTHFINTGSRGNCAGINPRIPNQKRGIIIGLVGARFERSGRMDSIHTLPPNSSSRQHPKLSAIFDGFFGGRSPRASAFDVNIYKSRILITAETLLLEANSRASGTSQTAFVHVVGLGLGVWQIDRKQPQWYIEVFTDVLRRVKLPSITTIAFSWINVPPETREECVAAGKAANIEIQFNMRDPADPLATDELLIVSYAWDGNSFPGNEYWMGSLSASGDPAAACFSTIAELHNPLINPYASRIKVLTEEAGPEH
jgi:hypothetical protein